MWNVLPVGLGRIGSWQAWVSRDEAEDWTMLTFQLQCGRVKHDIKPVNFKNGGRFYYLNHSAPSWTMDVKGPDFDSLD